MKLYFETEIPSSVPVIKTLFNEKLFRFLKPPMVELEIEKFDGCKTGDEIHLKMKLLKLPQQWVSLITEHGEDDSSWFFIDEGRVLPWPLSFWKHQHRVKKIDETRSLIIDDINFECHPKLLGPMIYPVLYGMFRIRPKLYKKYFKDNV